MTTRAVNRYCQKSELRSRRTGKDACGESVRRERKKRGTRPAYVLLETVIATGLLILGLAVIGAQVQGALRSIDEMNLRTRALLLADQHLAELDLGLVDLQSADNVEEGDFGPRYPDWGWRMITDETGVEGLYELELQVLYLRREDEYRENSFEYDKAKLIQTAYAFRMAPQPINFSTDLGLEDSEVEDLSKRLSKLTIPGLDPSSLDPALLAKLDFDQFIEALPVILQAFGFSLDDLRAMLPPDVLQQIKDSGIFDQEGGDGSGGDNSGPGGGGGG